MVNMASKEIQECLYYKKHHALHHLRQYAHLHTLHLCHALHHTLYHLEI
jgi:hypothetical protein